MNERLTIAAISWSNDLIVHNHYFGTSFDAAPWYGYPKIVPVIILPHDGCKNLGEAYNLGKRRAKEQIGGKPDIYIYMHQDVQLQDRSLGNKLSVLLKESSGIGACGPMGATIDTGGGYWFCHPKYQVGASPDLSAGTLALVSEARPIKVLDGAFMATNQDIEWSEEYESTHLFIEDMCMRIRSLGLDIWGVDTTILHKSGGTRLDDRYWRSHFKFQRNWEGRFANEFPPGQLFQAFMAQYIRDGAMVHKKIIQAGMYDIVWQTWFKKLAEDQRKEKRAHRIEAERGLVYANG